MVRLTTKRRLLFVHLCACLVLRISPLIISMFIWTKAYVQILMAKPACDVSFALAVCGVCERENEHIYIMNAGTKKGIKMGRFMPFTRYHKYFNVHIGLSSALSLLLLRRVFRYVRYCFVFGMQSEWNKSPVNGMSESKQNAIKFTCKHWIFNWMLCKNTFV